MTSDAPEDASSGAEAAARFRRADAVFDAALDLAPAARPAYLDRACAGDPLLRAEVEQLLNGHERAGAFLDAPAAAVGAPLLDGGVLAPGARLGRYRLVRPLGRGGMGAVWLARDERLERDVALKVVRDARDDADAPSRAEREARAAARLDHPHVAGVYDVGETGLGGLWFAMPYCPGGSLADRLRGGELPIAEVLRVARQLAAALAAAHAEGIVHRDVKPANVLFDAAGNVRLADFGIAKLAGHDVTRTREVLGTLGYLAPEQLEGEPVDHRADLWAFGVTLHEMVAGQRPFAGETVAALLRAILADAPPSLPPARGAPPALAALIERLLAKAPAERPASAAEVEAMLASMVGAAARVAPRVPAPGRTPRRAAMALAVLLPLAALGTVMATRGRDGRDGPDAPSAALPVQASVAVLPFESAGSAGDEPFAAGLTEEVIGALGRVPGLKVSSRTSTAALRARGLGARAIADTLGVRTVLEASVRRDGDRLRVAARLVRATDEQVLWTERYDRRRRDVFQVQEELAGAIVAALQPRLGAAGGQAAGTGTSARRVPVGTTDLTAYDDYLRGRFLRMRRSEESLALATRHFTRAIARDSAFAPAWAALANTTVLQVVFGNRPPAEMFPAARAAALRALALDSTVAEAHTALGHVLRNHDFDWDGSLARTARAMTLAPNDGTARVQHAITLLHLGRFDEAGAVLAAAHAVDPLDVTVFMTRGRLHLAAGRVPAAIGDLRTSVELNPAFSYAHEQLGFALLAGGHTAQAMGAFRRAAALSGVRDSAYLAWALAATGAPDTARAIVAGLERSMAARYVPPLGIAAAHAALGDADRAFRWLDRAAAGRAAYLDGLSVHPAFGALYADPRWPRLLARLGLPRALRPLHPRL